jgi:pilus assembly protein CpaB
MSIRTIAVVILALLCGVGVAMGVLESSRSQVVHVVETGETEPVLIAVARIERGAMLRAEDVEVRNWPKGIAPAGALRDLDQALNRAAIGSLASGEIILDAKLSPKNSSRGLAALIPPGMRAFTVQASHMTTNVAGFVLPGNKVDVLLNTRPGRSDVAGAGTTTTLLQAVEVLAVDQLLEAPADNRYDPKELSSVTLLVTPEQANLLGKGQSMGTLTFSLRNYSDTDGLESPGLTHDDLQSLGSGLPQSAHNGGTPQRRSVGGTVVTLRGVQRGQVVLGDGAR